MRKKKSEAVSFETKIVHIYFNYFTLQSHNLLKFVKGMVESSFNIPSI